MVLRSNGVAADHQAHCLGVYRMTDSHNGRPVYKQDDGEHYLFHDGEGWMVGSRVGHAYAWMRNASKAEDAADLGTGWQYLPLARADSVDAQWKADDNTLRVTPLKGEREEQRGVEKGAEGAKCVLA